MKAFRKCFSIFISIALLCSLAVPASAADNADALIEDCIVFTGTDDGEYLYIRAGESVCGVSDALQITFFQDEDDEDITWAIPVVDPADIIVELPAEENGNRVELFAKLDCKYVSSAVSIQLDGLLQTGSSDPVRCTFKEKGAKDLSALQLHYPDEEISACINHYREQDEDAQDYVIYCVEGDELVFETKWEQLKNRLSASWDGVQMRAAEDGSPCYTAVSGEGTLTLHVMRHIRYTSKVCVMTAKARSDLMVRSAAANPKQRLSAWMEILIMAPTMWLFPISLIFMPVVAPFAILAAPFADAFELLYMLITGTPLQMMR
ncbi:MAG: hypothetical protein IJT41_09255 [Clostridia bacterium]|nr:hypothetical protein [Clostridia bacterium]